MPENVKPAVSYAVMPSWLCRAFQMELRLEALVNNYPDGSSDRAALAQYTRHYFRLTERLSAADWDSMRQFFSNYQGLAFYYYNLRETVPPWTYDPTGQATDGRYLVTFDGQWSDNYGMARTEIAISLREVA